MDKIKERGFEEFLQDMHMKAEPQVIKDDLPDAFDRWLSNLDGEEYIQFADLYGREQRIVGAEKMSKHLSAGNEIVMSAFK